jgi:hypothetical protein
MPPYLYFDRDQFLNKITYLHGNKADSVRRNWRFRMVSILRKKILPHGR